MGAKLILAVEKVVAERGKYPTVVMVDEEEGEDMEMPEVRLKTVLEILDRDGTLKPGDKVELTLRKL